MLHGSCGSRQQFGLCGVVEDILSVIIVLSGSDHLQTRFIYNRRLCQHRFLKAKSEVSSDKRRLTAVLTMIALGDVEMSLATLW